MFAAQHPVAMHRFAQAVAGLGGGVQIGQVLVRRGDFIVGDKDGVLVVPREITLQVLEKSEEVVDTENLVRKAILEGGDPQEAYLRYGKF